MGTSRILLCLGLVVGAFSMWDTLAHTWDPAFNAPALALGATHTNYHAFREFTLSLGAVIVLLYGMFQPTPRRSQTLWIVMLIMALCYYGGWWLPGPIFGLYAPNRGALITHLIATIFTLASVALAWRHFSTVSGKDGRP